VGLKMMLDKLRHKWLLWFGHVRREMTGGVLRLVEEMEVSWKRKVGRPRKTLKVVTMRDLELIGVDESVALDRERWRKIIAEMQRVLVSSSPSRVRVCMSGVRVQMRRTRVRV